MIIFIVVMFYSMFCFHSVMLKIVEARENRIITTSMKKGKKTEENKTK